MEVRERPSAHDFLLYTVIDQGAGLLGIYVGNWPQEPRIAKARLRKSVIAGCDANSFEGSEAGLLSREVFVKLKPPTKAPEVVHFFYNDLTPARAREADAIISSLTAIRGVGCGR